MDLISREEIMGLTNIGESQFKSFRRLGLIDGYVKKTAIVKLDEKMTKDQGKEVFAPAGFTYLYPRTVLTQIKWIKELRSKGKNLMEIQNDLIREKIRKEEAHRNRARSYKKIFPVPVISAGENGIMQRFTANAVRELTEQIKQDNPNRDAKVLVFLVEPEKYSSEGTFKMRLKVKLDVENSQF